MTLGEYNEIFIAAIVGVPWISCLIHLWTRRGASFWKRAGWSLFLGVPLIGPLLYGCLFKGLAPHSPADRPVKGQGGVSYPDFVPTEHHPHDHF